MKKKGLVIGIIVLLVGISIMPLVSSLSVVNNNVNNFIEKEIQTTVSSTDDDIDWWPMFHHDLNRSGYSTSTGPETNNVLWAFQAEGKVDRSSPAVVDNKVFFGCDNINFYCLDSDTGEKIWHTLIGGGIERSSPAFDNGKIFFGTNYQNRGIYCLNATNGEIIWRYQTPPPQGGTIEASPAIYEGKVFIGAPNPEPGCMYCLDADTGEEIWISQSIDHPGSAAVYNGRVYFGAEDFNVYCLDADNGSVIWKYKTGGENIPCIHVTIYDNKLYVGGKDGLYCLNIEDGSLIWKYPTGLIYTTPCCANGNVYFIRFNGSVYCVDANSGEKIWDLKIYSYAWYSSPAYADGKIYFGSVGGMIYCVDADSGEKIWDFNPVSGVWCSPAIADGKVYIGCRSGEFLCFDGESDNNPPQTPDKINGPTSCKLDVEYTYHTSTYDPDGDQLYYKWDWEDGGTDWLGPFNSNETVEINITFYYNTIYTLRVIVKDSNHARSDWTELEVRVPRYKTIPSSLISRFLEQFPNSFPMIRQLLGL
ncbi:hypothetical protein AYK20_02245 [Thermoplasmatales archaeon SG8-52-1]|nr:MAG: hypothetical protein AYK20_02245 [Thermoplasmatales archaeon SG8-52-1]